MEVSLHLLLRLRSVSSRLLHRRIVGEKIRTYRLEAGLTQEKLAEKADLHHNFIGEVERGNMNTSLDSLVKISKALGVKLENLIAGL